MITEADYGTIKDRLFDWTKGINGHHTFAHAWEIVACLNLDSLFILFCICFILYSKTYRIGVSILKFYVIRAVLQQFQTLSFPDGIYWEDPRFPTLVNIYGKQRGFFYSGHIGFILLCTIEYFQVDC